MKRNNRDTVLTKTAATADGKTFLNYIRWYVPHSTLTVTQQSLLND